MREYLRELREEEAREKEEALNKMIPAFAFLFTVLFGVLIIAVEVL